MADRRKDTHPNLQATLFDAYAPDKIAERIEVVGVNKAGMTLLPTMTLAVLAGAFISFGAMFYSVTITGNDAGLGIGRMIGGLSFSLGLILVVVGGAELFTGNVLIVMGWANKRVSTRALLRNWGLVFAGNLAGALGMVVMAYASGYQGIGDGQVAETLVAIAAAKVNLRPRHRFHSGHPVQRACMSGGMAVLRGPFGDRQGAGHCVPDNRLRGARIRAFSR